MKVKVNTKVNGEPTKAVILTRKEYESLLGQIDTLNAALTSAYKYQEEQFQENKDLRVREGHLQDEINALKRRCERAEQESRDWYTKYLALQEQTNDEACALRDALNDRNARVDELEQRNKWLENLCDELKKSLEEAHKRIDEQQRIIADAGETITNQQRLPKYRSLWDLLTEHGLIIDTATLPSNSVNRPKE